MLPTWLTSTLNILPILLLVYVGMGTPLALLALPRTDWRDKPLMGMCAIGFSAALLTAYMFIWGTIGQNTNLTAGDPLNPMQSQINQLVGGKSLLTANTLSISIVIFTVIGWLGVLLKVSRTDTPQKLPHNPLASDEKFLIFLIIIATLIRWVMTSWTAFGWYDELWVYGYQARVYTQLGFIPTDIGYYPQFLQLQYTFAQIVAGGIDDHAARAVLPFLQIGSILAAYTLGNRLVNRRVGIILGAIWALYPHFGFWTRIGDLEIPQVFAFTASSAFFLMAWTQPEKALRYRYADLAGVWLGILMWIKPTGGALIWGVVLVVIIEAIRTRRWVAFAPRFVVAFRMGVACLPLGAVWYVRNLLYGHSPITFPQSYWLDEAVRSAGEFGWILLAIGVLVAFLLLSPLKKRPHIGFIAIGLLLIGFGVAPTIITPSRMQGLDWVFFVLGIIIVLIALADFAFAYLPEKDWRYVRLVGWAWALAMPYFITYFYSYSYHYRLSFPIVPLLILPTAIILGVWITPARIKAWQFLLRLGYVVAIFVVSLQGILIPLYDEGYGWDFWWTMPAKGDLSDASLTEVVAYFEDVAQTGATPSILAPGLQRLPFFFPTWDINITAVPRTFADMGDADYFIDGVESQALYANTGGFHNPFYASLRRENFTTPPIRFEDWREHFDIYALTAQNRFVAPPSQPDLTIEIMPEGIIQFGALARLVSYGVVNEPVFMGIGTNPVEFKLVWEVITPTSNDYAIFYHLYREDDPQTVLFTADGVVNKPFGWELNYYSTQFWQAGEYVIDRRSFYIPKLPNGDNYRVRVGFYDLATGERIPLLVNGLPTVDSITLDIEFSVNQPE
ncbi:MAG: glycosyltransferase family 39 protein [bacterium]|nr:glycosyltransferase family 39 protein [bacterium]